MQLRLDVLDDEGCTCQDGTSHLAREGIGQAVAEERNSSLARFGAARDGGLVEVGGLGVGRCNNPV